MNVLFCLVFSKYKVCSKSIVSKSVLTDTELNYEWNVNFLQNNSSYKNMDTESVLTKRVMNNKRNAIFLQNTRDESWMYQGRIKQ